MSLPSGTSRHLSRTTFISIRRPPPATVARRIGSIWDRIGVAPKRCITPKMAAVALVEYIKCATAANLIEWTGEASHYQSTWRANTKRVDENRPHL